MEEWPLLRNTSERENKSLLGFHVQGQVRVGKSPDPVRELVFRTGGRKPACPAKDSRRLIAARPTEDELALEGIADA